MNNKYSVIKDIVVWIIISIIVTIIFVNTTDISKISAIIISIIATVPILIARYNNYKLVISDEEIVLYKSFIKKTRIPLENIVEIEIGDSFTGSRIQGM
jgi:c-di-AMP phosphodiesterase-like protein